MKVYLSPSVQHKNIGTGKYGSEAYRMNLLCDEIEPELLRHGFHIKRNKPEMNLYEVVYDSNSWRPDIHIALHSNAGGGRGTETWHYPSKKGKELAKCIHKQAIQVIPFPDRGLKETTSFLELHDTIAPACLIEVIFHDNEEEAKWLMNNTKTVAEAIAKGVCDYFNIQFQTGETKIKLDVPIQNMDGVAVGQLRPILEALDLLVHYEAGEITVIGRDKILKLQVGEEIVTVME